MNDKDQEMSTHKSHDVFISFAGGTRSGDYNAAMTVCNFLESRGLKCWIYSRDELKGEEFEKAILDAIRNSKVLVLIYTAKTNSSHFVEIEIRHAFRCRLPIIPFKMEDVPYNSVLDFYLTSHNWLDATIPPLEFHLQKLAEDIAQLIKKDITYPPSSSPNQKILAQNKQEEQELRRKEEEEREKREKELLKAAEEAEKKRIEEERIKREKEELKRRHKEEAEKQRQEKKLLKQKTGSNKWQKALLILMLVAIAVAGYRLMVPSSPNLSVPNETNAESLPIPKAQETYTNSIGMDFVLISAGEFDMGSPTSDKYSSDDERPLHHVSIQKDFYLGKYEVTQKQWVEVMGSNPSYFKGENKPVEKVSWNNAQEFVRKLNEKEGNEKYRLPSEVEWEYACRAGTNTLYSFGDDELMLGEYAWYRDNSGDVTAPVGQKKPNAWGLYDMHGNVWEWVQDSWHDDYQGAPTDGSAWIDSHSSYCLSRGGSWFEYDGSCRSAVRYTYGPASRTELIGFRLLKEV
ncbi:SUMF1/EgtB/PvdO family nonheme iron enzyme [Methanomethylovorans sp.]|uniref:SUMF1/EgtB/PvdO family nonheme iron enzyme n=1 Tax=Methanomethylovorans sp. TaxID=2758717 RepID=UPI00351C4625